jgi:CheY-like chemotaxis protein
MKMLAHSATLYSPGKSPFHRKHRLLERRNTGACTVRLSFPGGSIWLFKRSHHRNVQKRVAVDKALVMVVEDEPLIRMNTVQMIEGAGYEVIEASDADNAMQILENRDDVQIVFTDINMPGSMDGLMLVKAIRNRWPWIYLIVTSGKIALQYGDIPLDARFIPKPYDARHVANILNEMIGRSPRPIQADRHQHF